MTTFQAIIYAIIRGFTEFLPLAWDAHRSLIPWLIHWPEASGALLGVLALGTFLAVFLYSWNDWASLLSSFLQIILLRRKPMTLDERMPFFILIATLPLILIGPKITEHLSALSESPWIVAGVTGGFILPLGFADSRSRRTKNLFDWNWLDALLTGIALLLVAAFPGIGVMGMIWTVASLRDYSREAMLKFAMYAMTPLLLVEAVKELHGIDFHSASPGLPVLEVSWLSLGVALIVSLLAGILTINALMSHVRRKGVGQYIVYRVIFAVGSLAVTWYRLRA
jgi:undecaprenyl-diphosphatase